MNQVKQRDMLKEVLKELNVSEPDDKALILEKYMEGVLEWNEKINLTAIKDREEFIEKHILDSLLCIDSVEFSNATDIIDVGTGGGFPGIPLAVCFPEKKFVLMDSLAKRINVIRQLCEQLGIKNVSAVHGRAEDLARQKGLRENFDLCVSRAVANMSTLSEYCIPFVKVGGNFIAYKGPDCASEINDAAGAIETTGGELIRIDKTESYNTRLKHELVYVRKAKNTPKAYPRKAGTPAKKPL